MRRQAPVFIMGSGRCGTTFLRRLLCAHPDMVIPPENYAIRASAQLWPAVAAGHQPWSALVRRLMAVLTQDAAHWRHFGLDAAILGPTLEALPPEHRTPADFWHAFHALYAGRMKPAARRWGDKTPYNAYDPGQVLAVFPQARVIHLSRDVYDVAASYGRMKGREGRFLEGAQRWVVANQTLLALAEARARSTEREAEQVLHLRYESLVRSCPEELRRVCACLGLDYADTLLESPVAEPQLADVRASGWLHKALAPPDLDRIGAGGADLSPTVRAEIARIATPLMQRLGHA